LNIGKNVVVIGAGNSAMDAARAAKRVAGVENVYLVYRRTRKYMPADREELRLALADGVEFKELLAPVSFQKGVLRCQKMELGTVDSSGRRSPLALSGEFVEIKADCIIAAVGEKVEMELLTQNGIALDAQGRIPINPENNETNLSNVFIGGDALRGPTTIVEAIADGTRFARTVLAREKGETLNLEKIISFDQEKQLAEIKHKKGILQNTCNPDTENNRCLECNYLCNLCVEVCPNRANFGVRVNMADGQCHYQVIHIDGMCNECGNCATFCPYDGAPYQDKFTLYWNEADFADSKNAGFVLIDKVLNQFKVRLGENIVDAVFDQSGRCNDVIPKDIAAMIWTVYEDYRYLLV
jgi:putative selenate reductase